MVTNFINKAILTSTILCCCLILSAQAPFKGAAQFRKFSIGINAGALRPSVVVGGSNDFTKPLYTFGYGANVKYQLTHYFALQADFLRGKLKANNTKDYPNSIPVTDRVNTSFETNMEFAVGLSGVITFGNINWLSEKNRIVPYISGGGGVTHYKPVFIKFGTTTEIPFNNGDAVKEFYATAGVGIKILLSDLINLDLGYRGNFIDNDNFDGTRLVYGLNHKDKISYGFLGIEFAFGKKGKKQLMFDNPAARLNNILQTQLSHLQDEVDTLNARLSTVDTDNDGVPDQFDLEANTPAGCPVTFRGISKDSDGDGVPDCKDKQLITPTECLPVNADGVGKCPDPECCKNIIAPASACTIGDLPSVSFKGNRRSLNSDAKTMLAMVATKLKASADCSISITGYPTTTKASQSLCAKRLEILKAYLTEKEGISADRIDTNCEPGGGDTNVMDIKSHEMK